MDAPIPAPTLMPHPRTSPTFVSVYGAQMIASIVNSVLYGVGAFVGMQYLKRYGRSDPILVKGTVFLLMLLATLETIFTDHQTYSNFILSFGDMADLNNIIFSIPAKYMLVYLTTFVAQLFFSACIWIVSSSLGPKFRLLVVPVLMLALLQFTAGTIQVALMSAAGTFLKLGNSQRMIIVVSIQGGGTAACDLLITFILVYIFRKTNTAAHRTKSLLDKLFNYALNRSAATSFCASLTVFLFYYSSGSFYFIIPSLATTHLNVVSVVCLLSSRSSLRDKIDSSMSSTRKDTSRTYRVPSFVAVKRTQAEDEERPAESENTGPSGSGSGSGSASGSGSRRSETSRRSEQSERSLERSEGIERNEAEASTSSAD
ncbi:hypothetical protein BDQ17DRAFT_1438002 [Cyathus striatus]|nr:hypothetical protein BDQ17DRAFT_1438002 [Cyathus striatus]